MITNTKFSNCHSVAAWKKGDMAQQRVKIRHSWTAWKNRKNAAAWKKVEMADQHGKVDIPQQRRKSGKGSHSVAS